MKVRFFVLSAMLLSALFGCGIHEEAVVLQSGMDESGQPTRMRARLGIQLADGRGVEVGCMHKLIEKGLMPSNVSQAQMSTYMQIAIAECNSKDGRSISNERGVAGWNWWYWSIPYFYSYSYYQQPYSNNYNYGCRFMFGDRASQWNFDCFSYGAGYNYNPYNTNYYKPSCYASCSPWSTWCTYCGGW